MHAPREWQRRSSVSAIKLGDQGVRVFDSHLIDAVLIAVERQYAPIASDSERLDGIEHCLG